MNLHPNWVALSTVDFSWKNFISESSEDTKTKIKKKTNNNCVINGDEIKNFYLDVVSSSCTGTVKYSKSEDVQNNSLKKHTVSTDFQYPNKRMVNLFLNAAQNNNISEAATLYNKCPLILNTTDSFGWTALMCAARSNALGTADFLLKHNADKDLKDNKGRTAFSLAKSREMQIILTNKKEKTTSNELIDQPNSIIYCEICKEYLQLNDSRQHFTSTLHIFNSGHQTNKTFYGIPESNKGYQLLLRTGWNKERGLGPDGRGQKFPIRTVLKNDRSGFGNKTDNPKVTHFRAKDVDAIKHRIETKNTLNKRQRTKNHSDDKLLECAIREELS